MDDSEDIPGTRKNRRLTTAPSDASDDAAAGAEPSPADAAAQLEDARRRNQARAQRFNTAFTEPNPFTALGRTDAKRLIHREGLVTGFATDAPEEQAKRVERAARWGVPVFDYAAEPAKAAGLTDAEVRVRQERRSRAARFGAVDELDVAIAKAAAAALADAPAASPHPDIPPVLRAEALHVRAYKYLPAASADLLAYFGDFRPAFIEWLNGVSVNVVFEDVFTAKRALDSLAESVPKAPGVPEVEACWKVALKPLVKRVTDRYAPAGSETTLYMRIATDSDSKERARRSVGPRSQGTYSEEGAYALHKEADPEDPALVASAVGAALRQSARALELPVAFRADADSAVAAAGDAEGGSAAAPPSRVITVILPGDNGSGGSSSGGGHDDRFTTAHGGGAARAAGGKRRRHEDPLDAAALAEATAGGDSGGASTERKVKGRGRVAAFRGPLLSRRGAERAGRGVGADANGEGAAPAALSATTAGAGDAMEAAAVLAPALAPAPVSVDDVDL